MGARGIDGRTARICASVAVGCIATSLFLAGCGSASDDPGESVGAVSTTSRVTTDSAPGSTNTAGPGASGRPTTPTVVYRPPYIERVEWKDTEVGPSLSVFPTTSGRYTQDPSAMAAAWREVIGLDAGADTPGMQAQFDCHWRFARIVEPEKPSWNLEPGRPVVTEEDMVGSRCNPGFAEEY
ncbi:DUF2599 domain-containing protein [Gordonia alkanivorans]|uniref:DUF2599 domain-containing protein n=1 Tax=Gordonia alkanivorans TaxID=84096 RepID=UPI002447A506|nr:DUF2599 domain-containing protein [Gordonia alkanivorans]MDH3016028.1 DUF2599 domain-containing protein [Gordonia alkanivorans]MDH3040868.1 DUF2599 domain-containing protein [Gordonia alkanivorans]